MPKNLNYPLASFQKAFILAEAVDSLGGSSSVENCAEKMKRKISGGFMVIVSSAQKFNLVYFEKSLITISEEYKLIKHSYTNTERIVFLRKAFLTPQLFNILFERFKGKELPVEMLDKILIREFGVEENTAVRVAGYFIDGLKTYGLLDGNILAIDTVEQTPERSKEVETNVIPLLSVQKMVPEQTESKIKPITTDTSFMPVKPELYEIQLSGPGINTKINIETEEDILILEAVINKLRRTLKAK